MLKLIITEDQFNRLIDTDLEDDEEKIIKNYEDGKLYKWFNNKVPGYEPHKIEDLLKKTIKYLVNIYKYKIKQVVVKDKGNIVGFIIYSFTPNNFDIPKDGKKYPVLLSTGIDPNYRGRGLFKLMFDRSELTKPYVVHTSQISPEGFWEKQGCDTFNNIGQGNEIKLCK